MQRKWSFSLSILLVTGLLLAVWSPFLLAVAIPSVPAGSLAGRIIAIDPGHGGNSGAKGPDGTWEDANVLAISLHLKQMLEAAGAKVVMTRSGFDRPYLSDMPGAGQLSTRMAIANRSGASLFISVHNDWNNNKQARGISTYYMASRGTAGLAATVQAELLKATGSDSWGTIPASFYVLNHAQMPAVVAEIGYISNSQDEKLLLTDAYRRKAATGLFNGAVAHFGTARAPATPPAPPAKSSEPASPAKQSASVPAAKPPTSAPPVKSLSPAPPPTAPGEKTVLGFWANWYSSLPEGSMYQDIETIDLFTPLWYTVQGDGSIRSRGSNRGFISSFVQDQGKKVVVQINREMGNDTMLTNGATRSAAVANIAELLKQEGYDGVNINFVGLSSLLRSNLTAFVSELSYKLRPGGYQVTVTVDPKWSPVEPLDSGSAAYDYAALAPLVDQVVVMAYDRYGTNAGPRALAPLLWVENVIRHAITLIPPQKLLLGVASYGYDWSGGKAQAIAAAVTAGRANQYGAKVIWDDASQEARFTYYQGGISHDIWFENSHSIDQKLDLVNRYGLAGIAIRNLGNEDARLWEVIRAKLK